MARSELLRDVVACAGVCALAVWVFLPTLANQPVYDDASAVTKNADVRADRTPLGRVLQHDFWGKDLNGPASNTQYRPLTVVSYRLDYRLGCGPNTSDIGADRACLAHFRWTDLALHAAATALVHVTARAVAHLPRGAAAGAAALFAAHPVHIESVATLYGRADVLCAVLQMLALVAAAGAAALVRRRSAATGDSNVVHAPGALALVAAALVLAAASVLAKEVGVVTALLVPLVYWHGVACSSSADGAHAPRTRMSPLVATAGAVLAALVLVLRRTLVHQWTPPLTWFDNPYAFLPAGRAGRALSYAHIHARYLLHLVWPRTHSPNYGFNAIPVVAHLRDPRNIGTAAAYAAVLGALGTALHSRAWTALLLLCWGGATFLPSSNIFFPVGTAFADRLLYVPSAAFCVLCAWAVAQLLAAAAAAADRQPHARKRLRAAGAAVAVAVVAGAAAVTRTRLEAWRTPLALWTSVTRQMPDNVLAHNNRAVELLARGRLEPALGEVRAVLAVYDAAASPLVRNHTLRARAAAMETRLARTVAAVDALRTMDVADILKSTNAVTATLSAAPTSEHIFAGQIHFTALCVGGALAQLPEQEDTAVDTLRKVDHIVLLDDEWRNIVQNVVLPRRREHFGTTGTQSLHKVLNT